MIISSRINAMVVKTTANETVIRSLMETLALKKKKHQTTWFVDSFSSWRRKVGAAHKFCLVRFGLGNIMHPLAASRFDPTFPTDTTRFVRIRALLFPPVHADVLLFQIASMTSALAQGLRGNHEGSDDNFSDDESMPLTHDIYGGR